MLVRNGMLDALWWNLAAHAHAPDVARLGAAYRLRSYAATQNAAAQRFALPIVATAVTPRPIVLPQVGLLHLDLGASITLPASAVPFGGPATTTIQIPNNAALANRTLFAQAVIASTSPASIRLSNLVTSQLLR